MGCGVGGIRGGLGVSGTSKYLLVALAKAARRTWPFTINGSLMSAGLVPAGARRAVVLLPGPRMDPAPPGGRCSRYRAGPGAEPRAAEQLPVPVGAETPPVPWAGLGAEPEPRAGRAETGLPAPLGAAPAEGSWGGGARSRSPGWAARKDDASDEGSAGSAEHLPGHHRHPLRWHTYGCVPGPRRRAGRGRRCCSG